MTISELVIKAAEELAAKKKPLDSLEARLADVTTRYEEADGDDQDAILEEMEGLHEEKTATVEAIEKAERRLEVLKRREADSKKASRPIGGGSANVITTIKKDPRQDHRPGDFLVKAALVKAVARITQTPEPAVLESYYGADTQTRAVFDHMTRVKTAVAPADTTTDTWASQLVRDDVRGFLEMLTNVSVGAALATRSLQLSFAGAETITVPRMEQLDGSAITEPAWVGQGGVIPLTQFAFGSQTIYRYKLASIVPMTMELVRAAIRDAEQLMRRGIEEAYSLMLDGAILSAGAAVSGVRPAGLLAGVSVGTGDATGGYTSVIKDITTLLTSLTEANLGQSPVLVLHQTDFLTLGMLTNELGQMPFRADAANGVLLGVPVISSLNGIKGTAVMIETGALATAFDSPEFMVSEQATLTMANSDGTAPTQADSGDGVVANSTAGQVAPDGGIGVAGAGAYTDVGGIGVGYTAQSMFQTWSMALRAVYPTSWAVMRPGAVAALDTLSWGS